jgi:hypothetical protein
MANSTPYVGLGAQVEFATVASPATYTVLNGVTSFARAGDKVVIDKTTNMSTTEGVDTKIASTQDPGTVDVKGFFYPGDTTQVAFEAIRLAATAVNFKCTYGSGNSISFTGIIENFTPSFPLEKPFTFDAKIAISGPVTYV